MIFTHLIVSNIVISVLGLIIYLLKAIFSKHLSAKINCYIWLALLVVILFSLLPQIDIYANSPIPNTANEFLNVKNIDSGVTDFDVVYKSSLYDYLIYIWIIGMAAASLIYVCGMIKINSIILNSERHYKNGFVILFSDKTQIPFSYGIRHKYIVIPKNYICELSGEQLSYIIYHEMVHHKHNDILKNSFIVVLNIVLWFNPVIYFLSSKIKNDMEMYCDSDTITKYNINYIDYGMLILNLKSFNNRFNLYTSFKSNKKHTKQRIINIKNTTRKTNVKCISFVSMILILGVFVSIYCTNVFGYTLNYSSDINYKTLDCTDLFEGYKGCFVLYDSTSDNYDIYNMDMAKKRYSPYSTFKPVIALNALKNNVISPDNSYVEWDNTKYDFEQWNRNQNLDSAMKNSVNWYFKHLDKQLGINNIKNALEDLDYGNKSVGLSLDEYWLDGSLKISPIEQTQVLNKVYNLDTTDSIKKAMSISDGLYGKTGSGYNSGWFVGSFNDKYFCVYIDGDGANGTKAFDIAKKVLNEL